mmetsp:Transcript_64947/g.103376  ORF Transcript_64947/g.103376 Transcript_64947/m.103376 type:complete len:333 (-) Transcript_64947:6-1004(-)
MSPSLALFVTVSTLYLITRVTAENVSVEMYARGFDQNATYGQISFIKLNNGPNLISEYFPRGHTAVVFKQETGDYYDTFSSDTCLCSETGYQQNDAAMVNYLQSLPDDTIVAIVTYADANGGFNTTKLLQSWGCDVPQLNYRESFVYLGTPNSNIPSWQRCKKHAQFMAPIHETYDVDLDEDGYAVDSAEENGVTPLMIGLICMTVVLLLVCGVMVELLIERRKKQKEAKAMNEKLEMQQVPPEETKAGPGGGEEVEVKQSVEVDQEKEDVLQLEVHEVASKGDALPGQSRGSEDEESEDEMYKEPEDAYIDQQEGVDDAATTTETHTATTK